MIMIFTVWIVGVVNYEDLLLQNVTTVYAPLPKDDYQFET